MNAQGCLISESSPGKRVTLELVKAYRDSLYAAGLADYTVAARLQQLANALKAIDQAVDWSWIHRAANRIHSRAVPMRDVSAVIQSPEDLLQLGFDLMRAADHDQFRTKCDRATLFRDGLLIAFLTLRPLRLSNLASLELNRSVFQIGVLWRISIDAAETKNSVPLEFDWPTELIDPLERYLLEHRPILIGPRGAKSAALWIARRGTALGEEAIEAQVKGRTGEVFEQPLHPHAFRHVLATGIAETAPGRTPLIMDALGHRSMKAADKYYNRASVMGAHTRYHETLKEMHQSDQRKGS